ncbi:ABC transporter substrate-binding protein [Desulfosediminicola ganghwensis]|uniref:ABC transporter substrate-binding protein n=1 Tax=Desulfosediminicola ganghwensis TaxID=2569540 RepID=UPI0010ABBFFC|nr:ABC transporter substrate-binding protein [Desulfosediminicola ganghwensis]
MKLGRFVGAVLLAMLVLVNPLQAETENSEWQSIVAKAKGQTVYYNGWGGSEVINEYIRWASAEVEKRYGVTVKHVKVTDIGDVVGRILAEKSAGRTSGGTVDLVWINGENFRAMKEQGLLGPPFTHKLPSYQLVDTEKKPTTVYDFTIAVENLEAPWGMAQLVFMYDTAHVTNPPANMQELLAYAKTHPGRVTYPAPPEFHGTTFLKQALLELVENPELLKKPVDAVDFEKITAPLWAFLDELHPVMWRSGRTFANGAPEMKQLLSDGEIFISLSFNPNDASNAIASGELPESIRTYVHEGGTIGNSHFLAVVFNSSAKEGAMVFADFLMSPEAQARKADPAIWGDPTVLAMGKLTPEQKQLFDNIEAGVATLSPQELGKVRLEPHASWVEALETTWLARYRK